MDFTAELGFCVELLDSELLPFVLACEKTLFDVGEIVLGIGEGVDMRILVFVSPFGEQLTSQDCGVTSRQNFSVDS